MNNSRNLKPDIKSSIQNHLITHKTLYCVLLAYGVLIGMLGVRANLAINDDWSYTWSVQQLVENNQLRFLASSASCFVPILTGGLICKIFGFSYSTLHMVSLAHTILAAAGIYFTLIELRACRQVSLLAASLFLANPFIVHLSICYMTDIPAITFTCWMTYFTVRALKTASPNHWLVSSLFLTLAVATRQSNITFVPAYLLLSSWLLLNKRKDGLIALFTLLLPVGSYFILSKLLPTFSVYPLGFAGYEDFVIEEIIEIFTKPLESFEKFAFIAAKVNCYTGLFMLPLAIAVIFGSFASFKKHLLTALGITFGAMVINLPLLSIFKQNLLMPYFCNLFNPPVVGTVALIGMDMRHWTEHNLRLFSYFSAFASLFTTALVLSATVVAFKLIKRKFADHKESREFSRASFMILNFACFAFSLAFIYLLVPILPLDRYILSVLVPLILICLTPWRLFPGSRFVTASLACTLALFAYSFIAAFDYTNFVNAKGKAIADLISQGVPADDIDGGPEHNLLTNHALMASYRFDKEQRGWTNEERGKLFDQRWWAINKESYVISLKQLEGYKTIGTVKYWSTLKNRDRQIFILKEE